MRVGRCCPELSGHELQRKLKSQPPSEAGLSLGAVEGSAVPWTPLGSARSAEQERNVVFP